MRGIGVVQDGFPFTHAELDRGVPRFWWSAGRKRAYAAALAGRGGQDGGNKDTPGVSAGQAGIGAAAVVTGRASDDGAGNGGA